MNHNGTPACQELLRRVQRGEVVGVLDPVVIGELSYMLATPRLAPRGRPPRTHQEVAQYLLGVLAWRGIEMEDKHLVLVALTAWQVGQGNSFVDCHLNTRAAAAQERVCTDNLRHFPDAVHPADLVGMAQAGKARKPRSR